MIRHSHPDKVKATANLTIETIQDRFVEITKAYKSYATFARLPFSRQFYYPQAH
jgi:preprotein translocase subunit Sec63